MRITSLRAAGFAIAASLAFSACASHGSYDGPKNGARTAPAVAIDVSNHNWMDVVVYVVSSSGSRVRLGSVTTGLDQHFRLPRSMDALTGNLYLEARPVGSTEVFNSGPIMVNTGSRIVWSIENQLALSNYHIVTQ